jgi:hypothetical protein
VQAIKNDLALPIDVISQDLITLAGIGWRFGFIFIEVSKGEEVLGLGSVCDTQCLSEVWTADRDEIKASLRKGRHRRNQA